MGRAIAVSIVVVRMKDKIMGEFVFYFVRQEVLHCTRSTFEMSPTADLVWRVQCERMT